MFFSFFLFRAPTDEQTPKHQLASQSHPKPRPFWRRRNWTHCARVPNKSHVLGRPRFCGFSWAASETNLGSWFCGWVDFVAGRMREQADWRFCGIGWRNVSSLKFGSWVKKIHYQSLQQILFGSSRCLWWRRRWWWWFESNFILGYHYYCVKDHFSFTTTARMDGCLPEAMIPLWKKTWVSADHDSSPRLLRSVREKRETEAPQIKFQFVTERCVYGDWLVSMIDRARKETLRPISISSRQDTCAHHSLGYVVQNIFQIAGHEIVRLGVLSLLKEEGTELFLSSVYGDWLVPLVDRARKTSLTPISIEKRIHVNINL